jgi:phospholipid/cholesterol/gamma-HCH transport system substrate-binding protein
LLGGAHVVIEPGGSTDSLKPGGQIENTQGAVDLFGLVGQMLRPQSPGPASPPPRSSSAPDAKSPAGA